MEILSPILSLVLVVGGLAALSWSSGVFVDGAVALARGLGMSRLVTGIIVVGFGTSAPELCVSAMSGIGGHANLSLGNAYGSDIFNIAAILGVCALIAPMTIPMRTAAVSGLVLAALALFSAFLLGDGRCSRAEALTLLAAFAVILPLYCRHEQKTAERADGNNAGDVGVRPAMVKLLIGLAVLIGSSHLLVRGAVDIAKFLGVSDLMIGLTVVAAGTSLPELATAIQSVRRGEHELVFGNIVGSNLFNTLAVVGLAVSISPLVPSGGSSAFSPRVLSRDLPFVTALSLSLPLLAMDWRHPGRAGKIGRAAAIAWLSAFAVYAVVMILQETGKW